MLGRSKLLIPGRTAFALKRVRRVRQNLLPPKRFSYRFVVLSGRRVDAEGHLHPDLGPISVAGQISKATATHNLALTVVPVTIVLDGADFRFLA